jgi:hypothetical protein
MFDHQVADKMGEFFDKTFLPGSADTIPCRGQTLEQRRTLKDMTACRTVALGGHALGCPECGHQQIAYNSCGNRHCPTCQATAAARWLEAHAADLLPVPYFHLVFTLPDVLDPIALANPRFVYDLLLRSAAETILQVAADPDRLDARTGVLAVLHTWGQTLQFHPHVHCVVPGGGLSPDRTRWVGSRPDYFLPVPVLSRVFGGKFLTGLRAAYVAGRLRFAGQPNDQAAVDARFEQLLSTAVRTDWVVHATVSRRRRPANCARELATLQQRSGGGRMSASVRLPKQRWGIPGLDHIRDHRNGQKYTAVWPCQVPHGKGPPAWRWFEPGLTGTRGG